MTKGTRKCKVCGVEYEYCHTARGNDIFRYHDVACCPEHGSVYFAKVLASRKGKPTDDVSEHSEASNSLDFIDDEDDEEYDELFEENFEDEDDEEDE